MGYYTSFSVKHNSEDEAEVSAIRDEIYKMNLPEFWENDERTFGAYAKWYDVDEDMSLLSSKFPQVLFVVDGEGEDGGDLWRMYAYGGAIQIERAEISYGSFDIGKLRRIKHDERYSYQ